MIFGVRRHTVVSLHRSAGATFSFRRSRSDGGMGAMGGWTFVAGENIVWKGRTKFCVEFLWPEKNEDGVSQLGSFLNS